MVEVPLDLLGGRVHGSSTDLGSMHRCVLASDLQHAATSPRVRSEPSDADTDHTLPYRQRYVAIVEDDTITYLAVEPNPGEVTITAAEKVLPWV